MKWQARIVTHKKEKRVAVYFEKDPELIGRIKKLEGVRWSATLKAWHLPDTAEYRRKFGLEEKISLDAERAIRIR